jgi:acyl-CoA reductase-like NAD-dependent aldehyde dehydrogenase
MDMNIVVTQQLAMESSSYWWQQIPLAVTGGNKFVLKPLKEKDTGIALLLVELATKAGLPPRVLNIMHDTHKAVNVIYSILI